MSCNRIGLPIGRTINDNKTGKTGLSLDELLEITNELYEENERLKKSYQVKAPFRYEREPPFELGDYMDFKLRVYLPKESENHFSGISELIIPKLMAYRLNGFYEELVKLPFWRTSRLWFEPLIKEGYDE